MRGVAFAARSCLVTAAIASAACSASASERFEFAGPERAAAILTARDAFIEAMTPIDRAIRLRTAGSSSEAAYLAFLAREVRTWSADEFSRFNRSLQDVERQLPRLAAPLPQPIVLIHTTDRVEEGAPHTRGTAIVLPDAALHLPPEQMRHMLFHELFHLLSRSNPGLRDELYGLIGFSPCGSRLELPGALASRLITNPDAPRSLHFIRVSIEGAQRSVVPLLVAKRAADRSALFDAFDVRFVEVDTRGGRCAAVSRGPEPRLYALSEIGDFFSQVGTNTQYVIHPEETLADDFALWMTDAKNIPDPQIVERLRNKLGR